MMSLSKFNSDYETFMIRSKKGFNLFTTHFVIKFITILHKLMGWKLDGHLGCDTINTRTIRYDLIAIGENK